MNAWVGMGRNLKLGPNGLPISLKPVLCNHQRLALDLT